MSKIQIKSHFQKMTIMPPTYMLTAILFMLSLHFSFPGFQLMPVPWNLFGTLPLLIGVIVSTLAEKQLLKAKTTVKPFIQATVLVTDGHYRYSRNPIYLGFVLVLAGTAMILGSLTPLTILPLFVLCIQGIFIEKEEQIMATTFGNAWLNYRKKTKRWI